MDDPGSDARHASDDDRRLPASYPARTLLVIGIGAVLSAGWLFIAEPTFMISRPRMWESPLVVAGFLGMLVGLAWMIRIFRGPRDEPPPWRYRDR
jgi:hypothetical protein